MQLPQGDTDAKIAVVPLEGAGSSFFFIRGNRFAQGEFKCLFGPFPTIFGLLQKFAKPKKLGCVWDMNFFTDEAIRSI